MIWPVSWPLPATITTSPGRHHCDCRGNCFGAVAYFARPDGAGQNFLADDGGLLGARIVIGDDRHVGLIDRNAAHDRPLALVPIAAATKHRNEPARDEWPAGIERRGKCFGFMRVIDDGQSAVSLADDFEPARHALEIAQRRKYSADFFPRRDGEASCNERVLRLIRADERQAHIIRAPVCNNVDPLLKTVPLQCRTPQRFA